MNNFFLGLITVVAVLLASFTISYLVGIYLPNVSTLFSFLGGMICGFLGMMFYTHNSL